MGELIAISYPLLCGAILLETLVLRETLRKAAWFQRFYQDFYRDAELSGLDPGTPAPKFSLPTLEPGKRLRTADLEGHPTVLLFVSAHRAAVPSNEILIPALHAWWHRLEGRVYLVCRGGKGPCRQFARDRVNGFPPEKTVLDEAGVLTSGFRVRSTPLAVELDRDACLKRYGRPEGREFDIPSEEDWTVKDDGDADPRPAWPDDRPTSGAAFARMDTTISCVLTRFRLNSPLSLVPFCLAFRRVRGASRSIGGLMEAVFLFENFRTCYTLSFWKDDWSIVEFGRVRAHIDAANSAFGPTYRKDLKTR